MFLEENKLFEYLSFSGFGDFLFKIYDKLISHALWTNKDAFKILHTFDIFCQVYCNLLKTALLCYLASFYNPFYL